MDDDSDRACGLAGEPTRLQARWLPTSIRGPGRIRYAMNRLIQNPRRATHEEEPTALEWT